MANDKVYSNRRIGWFIGPETAISSWAAPSLANLQTLVNMAEGIRIAGTDFGLQATEMTDDRSFADEAGAQELGYAAFGGNVSTVVPAANDSGSIHRVTHNTFKTPRTRLAVGQRFGGLDQATPLAAGQEINLFRVITDEESVERRQTGYSTTTALVGQDDYLSNYVIPPATAVALTLGGATGGAAGGYGLLSATYQGVEIAAGVTYSSSDPTKADVNAAGVVRYIAAGNVTITATYPGALAGTKALVIT